MIKLSPGPGDHLYLDSQRSTTKNHALKNGWSSNDQKYTSKSF